MKTLPTLGSNRTRRIMRARVALVAVVALLLAAVPVRADREM